MHSSGRYRSPLVRRFIGQTTSWLLDSSSARLQSGKDLHHLRSRHQRPPKNDLGRQVEDLKHDYTKHNVVKDIGSGLNFKRKGLRSILEQVFSGMVQEVVVAHTDRLCRYGAE
jgi:DNA invertase Pin-like site-specific DNA recombinase